MGRYRFFETDPTSMRHSARQTGLKQDHDYQGVLGVKTQPTRSVKNNHVVFNIYFISQKNAANTQYTNTQHHYPKLKT